jgi:phytoene synthase
MTPDEYCRQKAVHSGSSFYYASLFLPGPQRRAIIALRAYCREVSDVADTCTDAALARTTLGWWRQEIAQLFSGKPQHPVAQALLPAIVPFGLSQSHLTEIIDGVEMDLNQNRYLDFAALEHYCRRVSGAAGLLSASIIGFRDIKTLDFARTLGVALRLTDLIRNAGAHSRKGRIYLPMDELKQFNLTAADILNASQTGDISRLMAFQVERAERYFDAALAMLASADRRAQRPALIMAAIYRSLLEEIRSEGSKVLLQRTSLTPVRKLWIAWRTWTFA